MGHREATTWLRYALGMLAVVGMLVSCRAGAPVSSAPTTAAAGFSEGTGQANIRIELPEYYLPEVKIGQAMQRRVQYVDWTVAQSAQLWFMGSGIDAWRPGPSTGFTGVATRTATFTNVAVPTGKRRIIKVDLKNAAGAVLHTLWGVGDVGGVADPAVTITVTPYTTPTAEVFRDLIAAGDKERAMAVPIADVQKLVDNMLDFDTQALPTATGFDGNLDGQVKPIAPPLLDTYMLTLAVIKGTPNASGVVVPYTVPSPPFVAPNADLAVTPVRQATVVVKAIDTDGKLITEPCVVFVSDPVSDVQVTTLGSPVDQTFFPVAVGNWTAGIIDTVNGRRISAPLYPTLWDRQSRDIILSMPVNSAERMLGTYNLPQNVGYGFNGDNVHNSFAYLNNARRPSVQGFGNDKLLYFLDVNNRRIRYSKLYDPDAPVYTVVGDGSAATLNLNNDSDLYVEETATAAANRFLYFSETTTGGLKRIARHKLDAVGAPLLGIETVVDFSNATFAGIWNPADKPGSFCYERTTGMLYVGSATGGSFVSVRIADPLVTGNPVYPAAGCAAAVITDPAAPPYGGGDIVKSGNFLFYSGKKVMASDTGAVTIYPLMRRDVTQVDTATGAVAILESDPAYFFQEPFYTNTEVMDQNYTVDARRFFQLSPHDYMALDNQGNLYFGARDPNATPGSHKTQNSVFRVTNALGNGSAAQPWFVNWFDLRLMLGLSKVDVPAAPGIVPVPLVDVVTGIAVDPIPQANGLNDLFCAGHARVANPAGVGTVVVNAIYRLRL